MTNFQVWAPKAKTLEIEIGRGGRQPLRQANGGWWQIDLPEVGSGTDYAYVINGGSPVPDPRSPWQPNGVHGPSRTLDHSTFRWTDRGWQPRPLAAAVIYELHMGTFTPEGTFAAAIEKLDHLVDLGVTHVEIMPVAAFPGERGWGYDGVSLYAPHQAYGGPEGLKQLVNACHLRGLAVILDVVYNHLGPDGNYLGMFAPYFTDHHTTGWGDAVNLDDAGSDEVRRFFIDNALMWLRDYHMDGLRLDAVHALVDESAVHFLEELAAEVRRLEVRLGRPLVLIAESELNNPRLIQTPEIGGYGLDAQWCDEVHHALHVLFTGEQDSYYMDYGDWAGLAKALAQGYIYDGNYSKFRGRKHGRPLKDVPSYRLVVCSQNHDQIGNRAQGDRLSHLVSPDLLKIGAALVFTSPFVPMLFQGEEWGASSPFQFFTDFHDEALGKAVSEGRRNEFADFGWDPEQVPDPQAAETFQRSKLNWGEISEEKHADLLAWHRKLITLRHTLPALGAGSFVPIHVRYDETARWLVVDRGEALVVCNLSEAAADVPLAGASALSIQLASHVEIKQGEEGLHMPGSSVAILACAAGTFG